MPCFCHFAKICAFYTILTHNINGGLGFGGQNVNGAVSVVNGVDGGLMGGVSSLVVSLAPWCTSWPVLAVLPWEGGRGWCRGVVPFSWLVARCPWLVARVGCPRRFWVRGVAPSSGQRLSCSRGRVACIFGRGCIIFVVVGSWEGWRDNERQGVNMGVVRPVWLRWAVNGWRLTGAGGVALVFRVW